MPQLKEKEMGWYHTLELPGEVTPGWFDLRPYVHHYGLPEDMTGMRALDVGTWDGFWAFEMERRGAEVTALDLDDEADLDWLPRRRPESFPTEPRGAGFRIAHERLNSSVERVNLSIYDAVPEDIGQFDVVLCGSVLIHLRDQLLAMERIANLCRGVFISSEEYDRVANLIPMAVSRFRGHGHGTVVYWRPNVKTWNRMLWTAGFDQVELVSKFKMKSRDGFSVPHVVFHCRHGS